MSGAFRFVAALLVLRTTIARAPALLIWNSAGHGLPSLNQVNHVRINRIFRARRYNTTAKTRNPQWWIVAMRVAQLSWSESGGWAVPSGSGADSDLVFFFGKRNALA